MSLSSLIKLIRIEHWVKNLFLFIPAFFAARLSEPLIIEHALLGFLAFSMVASSVYVLNDIVDAPNDRNHPDKCRRPIASGAISQQQGIVILGLLLLPGIVISALLSQGMLIYASIYFLINVAYSFSLKHIAIVDISIIGVGFLLRVFAGGAVTGVEVSQWLIILTFLIALILGLAKRRGEYVVAMGENNFRKALEGYNLPFLDMSMVVCSTVAVVAYLMYCFSPEVTSRIGSDKIFYTAFFVVTGVLRYLQLTLVFNKTESPTRALLRDRFLQLILLSWIASFIWLLYVKKWLVLVG
ncbi:MAG: decaprenyl-phosphate phosphoribosyltransferase [Lewinellaceae bacterium]|nr:decaprenyl-phosphate phosphoribosyltransferase [Saprospiraceae bacterium]MCB9345429.1 decaprenyl-phosphate phosphoribosyltransferase [Lewinellaceae bacterium]